jgi:hypothetical protein
VSTLSHYIQAIMAAFWAGDFSPDGDINNLNTAISTVEAGLSFEERQMIMADARIQRPELMDLYAREGNFTPLRTLALEVLHGLREKSDERQVRLAAQIRGRRNREEVAV